ncbi:putative membrane protein [Halorhabdus sp. SVX81]|uniref:DUF6159 family protein n=1 Tax=Halorhabdus sp. SVX81 TaxID=2978283 RepID=UPI0023DAA2F0|nr:DUF6159 family protein [Halorhabdus sp. SVX81]WEL18530.1 putative membrane protein [Halorhabdus sp. SVX81]
MGLFKRISIGFGLARRSGRVLRAHPNLLAFPLLGGLAGLAFVMTVFGGLFVADLGSGVVMYATLFVVYVIETFIASFFTAALVAATRETFRGEEPTVRASLAIAWEKRWQLLAWSVIAAVVGVIIRGIEESSEIGGTILAAVFSFAWGVMTYFIVPVIVFEEPSITGMFKQSGRTIKRTWGESLGTLSAISIVTVLLVLGGLGVAVVTFLTVGSTGLPGLLATVVIGGGAVLLAFLVGQALTGVAKTALYVYATEEEAPEFFEDMDFSQLGGGSQRSAGMAGGRI